MKTTRRMLIVCFGIAGWTAGLLPAVGFEPVNLLPNGSFEFWTRYGEEYRERNGDRLWSEDPLVPVRWSNNHWHRRITIERSEEARSGRYAARVKGPVELSMHTLEVLPGAEYTYGVWVRGEGSIEVRIEGHAVEGRRRVATASGAATDSWQRVGGTFQGVPHIRRVSLVLAGSDGPLFLDDAHIAAELDHPHDADAVLRDPYGPDEHTILFENFEGPEPAFSTEYPDLVSVTDAGGGRFGRGLRLDPVSEATILLGLDRMPEEGTLEFWVSQDMLRRSSLISLLLDRRRELIRVGTTAWSWLDATGGANHYAWMPYDGNVPTANQLRPGQWRHKAITWDRSTVRTYVDGVLMSMQTRGEIDWPGAPTFLRLGVAHAQSPMQGVVDEIRLSTVRRYGPVVPRGAVETPPPVLFDAPGGAVSSAPSDRSDVGPTPAALAAARREMPGAIPSTQAGVYEDRLNAAGAYVYEATSLQPIVEDAPLSIEADRIVPGLTVARLQGVSGRIPDGVHNTQAYWTLGAIEPGAYGIGIWYQSGNAQVEAAQPRGVTVPVYLNGRMIQLGTHGDPVQVAPGVFFAEAHAAAAVELRPGDEIAVGRNRGGAVARLTLRREAPEPGPHRMPTNFGGLFSDPYTALGVNVDAVFMTADGRPAPHADPHTSLERRAASRAAVVDADGRARVDFVFANPLPEPVTVAFTNVVRAYYFTEVARDEGTLTLPPHGRIIRSVMYEWAAEEPAHMAFMILRAVDPPPLSAPRDQGGLGWPEHEVYRYFNGHRHALPWPNPYAYRNLRRITLTTEFDEYRKVMDLDARANAPGAWQLAYTTALDPPMPPPEELEFNPKNVPFPWGWNRIADMDPRPHGVYVRRQFVLPETLSGHSYRLMLDHATDEATVYINGIKTGNLRGAHTPLICDITRAVKPGTNEVTIVVRDMVAIMNPAYVNTNAPVPNLSYLDAPGLFSGHSIGMGSVSIEAAPAVSTEAVFVIPSVRKKTLGARLAVANRSEQPVRVRVKAVVLDGGEPSLTVGERVVELDPHAPFALELETPWANPRLWGPADPHLYTLVVEVTDAATGARLDWRRDRFGFRESWIEGAEIMFNGVPVRPKGTGPLSRLNPDGEFRFIRRSRGDGSDETGILGGCYIGGLQNSSSPHNVARDVFWEAAEQNALAKMPFWWNRPSVMAWDLSNEWLCFLWHDQDWGARRFKHLSDVVRATDPTRWTFANAEGDLRGLLDNYSFHYMNPYFLAGREAGGYGMHGHSPYFPDGEFWRPLDRHFKPGAVVPLSTHHRHVKLTLGEKPIMDSEFLWKCGNLLMPPGTTRWAGEEAVLSPAVDSSSGPIAWKWKTKIDGHRDLGVSTINPYSYHAGLQRGAYLDQTFILPENQRRGFAGRTETRRFALLNGIFREADMHFSWRWRGPGGTTLEAGEFRKVMPSGGHATGEFAFTLPDVAVPTVHTLSAELHADGRFLTREEWDIEVWPDAPVQAGPLARQVMLFDPESGVGRRESGVGNSGHDTESLSTAQALAAAGVSFERIADPGAPATPPEGTLLVIGENALDTTNTAHTASLAHFLDAGGRVLVLRQRVAPRGLPAALETREWASQVFLRTPDHPVMAGLDALALHFWQPDRSVATGAYRKPDGGNFVSLADIGQQIGMEWVALGEYYRGRGLYLLCQIPVIDRYAVEPMARELLARMIRYAGGEDTYASPTGTLAVVAGESSPILKRVEDAGAEIEVQRSTFNLQPSTLTPLLIDAAAGRALSAEKHATLGEALRAGATVVVAGATPDDAAWLGELAGTEVTLSVPPYRMWDGRAYRHGFPRWTMGLSHLDHYWKRYDGGERAENQAEDATNMLEPLQHYAVRIANGREHVFPGALAEIAVGTGRLLLDQRRWWTANPEVLPLAHRQISALMTALDVALVPEPPMRELPREVEYRIVGLDAFLNLDVTDAGPEGWNQNGFRDFPSGRQVLQGVPFEMGGETVRALALRSGRIPVAAALPASVEIPLGFETEGLFFLHVAAASEDGEPLGRYTIAYADGQATDVVLTAGDNILDWLRPHQLTRERGTRSQIVWTGSTPRHPLVAVSRMLWVNPRPEVPLRSVTFSGAPEGGMPVLLALTAAVPKGRVALSPEAASRGRELLEQGREAVGAERWEAARRLLLDALRQNPALGDGYPLLADVAERSGNEDWQLEAYRLWAATGPRLPLPWNRVGEILERHGDAAGALEAYKQSLEVEWNQPPVMEARRRLEAN